MRLISVTKRHSANQHEHENKLIKLLCDRGSAATNARKRLVASCNGKPWADREAMGPLAFGARSCENMQIIDFPAWKIAVEKHTRQLMRKAAANQSLDSDLLQAAREL